MLPNFLIVGAMKSGTTSLWRYINSHPEAFLSNPKEPAFFVDGLNWSRGWGWYKSLFDDAGDALAVGEASTHYTKLGEHEDVAPRIYQHLPEVKLIYVMRNPVERAISHYWHCVRNDNETRPPLRAIKGDNRYLDFGRYAWQIESYVNCFGRDRIKFLTFERLASTPAAVMHDVFSHIGVDPTIPIDGLGEVHNGASPSVRKVRRVLHYVRWSPWWTSIAPYVPSAVKEFGKRREYQSVERAAVDDSEARRYLSEYYKKENELLYRMIGHGIEEWSAEARQDAIADSLRTT